MRGRKLYSIFKPAFAISSTLLGIFPSPFINLTLVFFRAVPTSIGVGIRYMLVNRLSKSCGDNVAVFENVYMYHVDRIEFGSHVSIHPMCYVMGFGGISIGSNVSIAHGTSIITTNHDFEQSAMAIRDAPVEAAPVTIGDDVWIGAGVRILAGVTIGNHVVVGANAVVTSDVSSNTLVAGVPARPIKHLNR